MFTKEQMEKLGMSTTSGYMRSRYDIRTVANDYCKAAVPGYLGIVRAEHGIEHNYYGVVTMVEINVHGRPDTTKLYYKGNSVDGFTLHAHH